MRMSKRRPAALRSPAAPRERGSVGFRLWRGGSFFDIAPGSVVCCWAPALVLTRHWVVRGGCVLSACSSAAVGDGRTMECQEALRSVWAGPAEHVWDMALRSPRGKQSGQSGQGRRRERLRGGLLRRKCVARSKHLQVIDADGAAARQQGQEAAVGERRGTVVAMVVVVMECSRESKRGHWRR